MHLKLLWWHHWLSHHPTAGRRTTNVTETNLIWKPLEFLKPQTLHLNLGTKRGSCSFCLHHMQKSPCFRTGAGFCSRSVSTFSLSNNRDNRLEQATSFPQHTQGTNVLTKVDGAACSIIIKPRPHLLWAVGLCVVFDIMCHQFVQGGIFGTASQHKGRRVKKGVF